jgi:alanine racemase
VKSWVEVSERRLITNYKLLVRAAGEATTGDKTAVLAVVKANAYGHGAGLCAPVLASAGAEWLGVADVSEGEAVREALTEAGIPYQSQPRILVMSGVLGEEAEAVVRQGLTPVVWERDPIERLADAVLRSGAAMSPSAAAPLAVHLEIDTGMARQGIAPGADLDALLRRIKVQTALRLDGVMTHFASSEVVGSPQTLTQRARFEEAIAAVSAAGLKPAWVHAGNSSTLDNQGTDNQGTDNQGPDHQGNAENLTWLRGLAASIGARPMVRSGIALYGYCLPIQQQGSGTAIEAKVRHGLEPLMTWKTRIIGLRDVHAGDAIGYNGIFVAERTMRLALLPIGYSDGLRRELSSSNTQPGGLTMGGWTMVHGQRAAIVGRVSMNLTVVDVTGIPGVTLGDEVVVLGDGVTADDHAHLAHTIAYEIVCGVRAPSQLV